MWKKCVTVIGNGDKKMQFVFFRGHFFVLKKDLKKQNVILKITCFIEN